MHPDASAVYSTWRRGHNWTVQDYTHIPKYAYTLNIDDPQYTITPSDVTGNITLTASSVTTDNGTAQAGTSNTITLKSSSAYTSDDQCVGLHIKITSGTGSGQVRHITDYVASTKVATVYPAFTTTPDNTSQYQVRALAKTVLMSILLLKMVLAALGLQSL